MILPKRRRGEGDGGGVIFNEKASRFLNNMACNVTISFPSRAFFDRATEQRDIQRCHVRSQYSYQL